jgi:hypothetical protein
LNVTRRPAEETRLRRETEAVVNSDVLLRAGMLTEAKVSGFFRVIGAKYRIRLMAPSADPILLLVIV